MRKGYDGLSGLVRNELGADPLSGDVYVFFSRNRRRCYEQLSGIIEGKIRDISYQHLIMLLSGISLVGLHQRPRYEMKKTG